MKKVSFLSFLVLFVFACSPSANTSVVLAPPIEKGKDPACVKNCKGKQTECVDGARSSTSRVYELCYEGYEICIGACKPK